MTLMNRFITFLENEEYVFRIFLNLSKVFHTADHVILHVLKKLTNYGFKYITLKWYKSYLSNREQYVT